MNIYLYAGDWGESHAIYSSGIISFAIGYMFIVLVEEALNIKRPTKQTLHRAGKIIIISYWLLAIIGVGIGLYIIFDRGVMATGNLLFNLRYAHSVDHQSSFGVGHFSLFPLALAIYYAQHDEMKKSLLAVALNLFASLVVAERTSMLLIFIAVTYTFAWKRRIGLIHILVVIVLFFILSTIFAFSMNKMEAQGEFYIFRYMSYGLSAFNDHILTQSTYNCPQMIFGNVIGGVLDALDLYHCNAPGSFVKPGMFNVYTYISNPYLVGGQMAVIISMFVLGVCYSILYNMAKRTGCLALAVLSCLIYPIAMVFYAWQFSISTFIYLPIIMLPLFYKIRVSRITLHRYPQQCAVT